MVSTMVPIVRRSARAVLVDEEGGHYPPARDNPVAPAHRSAAATTKAFHHTNPDGQPVRSFRGLLDHLATLTRNDIRYGDTEPIVPTLSEPTTTQRRAFQLLDTPILFTLK